MLIGQFNNDSRNIDYFGDETYKFIWEFVDDYKKACLMSFRLEIIYV